MTQLTFNCPHCNEMLELPPELSGQMADCPNCEMLIQLPEVDLSQMKSSAAPQTPDEDESKTKACCFCGEDILVAAKKCKHCGEFLFPDKLQSATGQEKEIWIGHPSKLYYIKHWLLSTIFILGGAYLSFVNVYLFAGPYILIFLPLAIWMLLYAILDQKTRVFTHTTRKVMAKVGIISRKTREVAVRDIRSINMNQGILERIFGLGTVQIGSAGTGGIEVEFKGIKNPILVRDRIRRTKDEFDK